MGMKSQINNNLHVIILGFMKIFLTQKICIIPVDFVGVRLVEVILDDAGNAINTLWQKPKEGSIQSLT